MEYTIDYRSMSQNGRWGLEVIGLEGVAGVGSLTSLGEIAGVKTYRFTPGQTGMLVVRIKDRGCVTRGMDNCRILEAMDLQSNGCVSLLVGATDRPMIWKQSGYAGRSHFYQQIVWCPGRGMAYPEGWYLRGVSTEELVPFLDIQEEEITL